jgi:hypothetical protein
MTTAWSWSARGDIGRALKANVGGVSTAAMALVAAPWLIASSACGRWLGGRPSSKTLAIAAVGCLVLTLVDWIVRIV